MGPELMSWQLNPDLTHDASKSTIKRVFKTEDLAASGKEWRSPAFDLLDSRHPAVTGQHHPQAVKNAGHGDVKTSAVAAARGETTHQGAGTTGSQGMGAGLSGAGAGVTGAGQSAYAAGVRDGQQGAHTLTSDYGSGGGVGQQVRAEGQNLKNDASTRY